MGNNAIKIFKKTFFKIIEKFQSFFKNLKCNSHFYEKLKSEYIQELNKLWKFLDEIRNPKLIMVNELLIILKKMEADKTLDRYKNELYIDEQTLKHPKRVVKDLKELVNFISYLLGYLKNINKMKNKMLEIRNNLDDKAFNKIKLEFEKFQTDIEKLGKMKDRCTQAIEMISSCEENLKKLISPSFRKRGVGALFIKEAIESCNLMIQIFNNGNYMVSYLYILIYIFIYILKIFYFK